MCHSWTALPAGDRALILEFGQTIERGIVEQIDALDQRIHQSMERGELTGVIETVPTFRSLAILFDPLLTRPELLQEQIAALDGQALQTQSQQSRHWQLPVSYGADSGPDLESVASLCDLTIREVIELHHQTRFRVYMLGFLPGFAFMGDTPPALHLPRRSEPRTRVPAGSVAIANQLTAVYPWQSPGGWHILGHCPIPLFNARLNPPALLRTGDRISFRQIGDDEHQSLQQSLEQGQFDTSSLLVDAPS